MSTNIIIEDESLGFDGSGSGDITGPVEAVEDTTNLIDADSLNLVPLSEDIPEENDILIYKGSVYVPSAMALELNSDIAFTNVIDNNILTYNSSTSKWENTDISTLLNDNIQFDSITSPLNSDVLSYNGTKWVPVSRESLLNSLALTNLSNVQIDTILDKQLLSYDSSTSKWVNKTLSFYNLPEISSNAPSNDNFLVYNSTTSKWEPTDLTSDLLTNFSDANPSDKSLLIYNLSLGKWEPISFLELSNEIPKEVDLLELKNVSIVNKIDGQFLSWDSTTQKWINYSPSLVDLSDYNSGNTPANRDILRWDSTSGTWVSEALTDPILFGYDPNTLGQGKILVYNSTTSKWEPKVVTLESLVDSGIDVSTIESGASLYWDSLTDSWTIEKKTLEQIIDLPSVQDTEILSYNSGTNKWENKDISELVQLTQDLDNLNDVTLTASTDKNTLVYNSTTSKWENKTLNLGDLKNLNLAGLSNGNFLVYDSVASKWKPKSLALETLIDETLIPNDIPNGSTIVWDSLAGSWKTENKTLEELLGFDNSTNDNSVLVYDQVNQVWKTDLVENLISFSNNINSLIDVDVDTLEDSDILVYNSITSKWVSQSINLEFLSNIDSTGKQDGYTLAWNSSSLRWEILDIDTLISTAITSRTIDSANDVSTSNLVNNDVLVYNSTTTSWENNPIRPENLKGLIPGDSGTYKYLTWNSTEEIWEFSTYTLHDLIGVNLADLVDTDILIWDGALSSWKVIPAFQLNTYIAQEIDLGELKNVDAPNKLHNQVLTWDSALQKWIPKSLSDLGATISGTINIIGNDWVTLFNNTLNY